MKAFTTTLSLAAILMLAPSVWAHYTWLVRTHYNAAGTQAVLELGHGHHFPLSEEAPGAKYLKVYLETPKGPQEIEAKSAGKALKLEAPLADRGLKRVYYVRDRGVISQTAAGWKDGGKDQHPGAKASMKSIQYGIAWIGFTGTTNSSKALGLDLELNYEKGMKGRRVRAFRKGKPARDLEIIAVLGEDNEKSLGKTDKEGYVIADSLPTGKPVLFTVRVEEQAPKGSNYDKNVLSCSLSLPAE